MTHLAIAGLQLELKAGDNLDQIADQVATTKRRFPWIDLILLGELSAFGPSPGRGSGCPSTLKPVLQTSTAMGGWLIILADCTPGSAFAWSTIWR